MFENQCLKKYAVYINKTIKKTSVLTVCIKASKGFRKLKPNSK